MHSGLSVPVIWVNTIIRFECFTNFQVFRECLYRCLGLTQNLQVFKVVTWKLKGAVGQKLKMLLLHVKIILINTKT